MRKILLAAAFFLTACAPVAPHIKHLSPTPGAAQVPATCKIAGVVPDSPAHKAGLQAGDTVISVNGSKPADALAVSDLIDKSGAEANFEVADAAGKTRTLKVSLSKEKPRLGAACDLTGWRKSSVSGAGNESITVFNGPYAFTVSGILDKGVAFMRVRISNHSDQSLPVSTSLFTVADAGHASLKVLSPEEVIYFLHGKDAVPFIVPPASSGQSGPAAVPADSIVRQAAPPHKSKDEWSRSDDSFVHANAEYLNKESLWPDTIAPGKAADGLIYFLEPKTLPVTIEAHLPDRQAGLPDRQAGIGTATLAVSFGEPKPSTNHMSMDELIEFFDAQKKGTPVRLTLKNGTVFVGKYSSYDSINEIIWFDTPSGVLLTTSSFGLRHITFAEVLAPGQDKKQPTADPLN